jgi:hypothetical protein
MVESHNEYGRLSHPECTVKRELGKKKKGLFKRSKTTTAMDNFYQL